MTDLTIAEPAFVGRWSGTHRLYLSWLPEPEFESASELTVRPVARGRFLEVEYTWSHEGTPHAGILLLSWSGEAGPAHGGWVDSWHQTGSVMLLTGEARAGGSADLRGSYSVEGHPDWSWRIEVSPKPADEFELRMYNIAPEGTEELAVCAEYRRKS